MDYVPGTAKTQQLLDVNHYSGFELFIFLSSLFFKCGRSTLDIDLSVVFSSLIYGPLYTTGYRGLLDPGDTRVDKKIFCAPG